LSLRDLGGVTVYDCANPPTKTRNQLGLAQGGIQLSQVAAPTALNTGDNSGESFCFLFGTHHKANVRAGYIVKADARQNHRDAVHSQVGK
jgi:Alpha/beta hydrolase domain